MISRDVFARVKRIQSSILLSKLGLPSEKHLCGKGIRVMNPQRMYWIYTEQHEHGLASLGSKGRAYGESTNV